MNSEHISKLLNIVLAIILCFVIIFGISNIITTCVSEATLPSSPVEESDVDSLKSVNRVIIVEVEQLDSIKDVKIKEVKNLDNDSTLKLFYELLGR